jgi:hypothetical protein
MTELIKIYTGSPTSGSTDGTLVSSGGTTPINSGAITVPSSGFAEGSFVKLAVRCSSGYTTVESSSVHATLSISTTGSTGRWQLSFTSTGSTYAWDGSATIGTAVTAANKIFYARARVSSTEAPANDTSAKITVSAIVGAV